MTGPKVVLFRDLPSEGWPSMERYADELEAALKRLDCDVRSFVAPTPWRRLPGRSNALANYVWRGLAYSRAARGQQSEVNHILDVSYAHLLRHLDPSRTVVTCHDVAPLAVEPTGWGVSRRLWLRSFEAMLGAARIITGSTFSQDEILSHSRYPAAQIHVIGYGASPAFRRVASRAEIEALRGQVVPDDRPLLLHVGSCQPRKNVEAILRALPCLADIDPVFVQAGGRFTPAQQRLIASLGVTGRVRQFGPVDDARLAAWYQAADLLVFPSRYEGFGLPVLEAMACGTPVACAEAGALPEVAGGAAVLFDPNDTKSLAGAVRLILADGGLRRSLIEGGRERSLRFTWEETARRTLEVYENVAAHSSAAG